jgi:ribosomal protein S17E
MMRTLSYIVGFAFMLAFCKADDTPPQSPKPPKLPSITPTEFDSKKEADKKNINPPNNDADKINFKFSDVKKSLVIIEHSNGCGSGFIAREGRDTYIYTNQHVVFSANGLKFKTLTGQSLKPVGFELSQNRDIIRFKLKEPHPNALGFNVSPAMEEPVAVFGNSAGGGGATEIFGNVTGIGSDRIEVSAKFVQGNSGSPIFDKNKNVLGMATYVTRSLKKGDWVKEGTRFESPRYFAFKVDKNITWKRMKWKIFQKLGRKIMSDREGITEIVKLAKTWATAPYSNINEDDYKELDIRTWIKKHNDMARKHEKQKTKGFVRNVRKLNKINKSIRDDLEENYQSLSELCERRSKAIRFKTQRYEKYLTKYINDENEQNQAALKFLGDRINEIGAKIASGDAFYLRNSPY